MLSFNFGDNQIGLLYIFRQFSKQRTGCYAVRTKVKLIHKTENIFIVSKHDSKIPVWKGFCTLLLYCGNWTDGGILNLMQNRLCVVMKLNTFVSK